MERRMHTPERAGRRGPFAADAAVRRSEKGGTRRDVRDTLELLPIRAKEVSNMARGLCVLALAGLASIMGCEQKPSGDASPNVTSEDVRREAGESVDTAAEFSNQSKEEFQTRLEARLKKLDDEIAALREKGSDLKDEAKIDWERKLADFEAKRDAARAKLAEVKQSSAEAWKEVQQGAQSAWDDLEQAYQDASRKF
jgi:TolA-binding protein